MTAEFVAWVQVLIYVGAVVVLLVFGLMLTRAPIGPSDDADSSARIPALLTALAAGAALLVLLVQSFRDVDLVLDAPGGGSAESIGQALFAHWVLPFELLSVLLLGALVGAIALSRRDDGGSG
jgi:NADH-quinone oxidoreductase subunit J